ncbi:MAG: Trk family potassium uptake protein [Agathobacter sp.]|nr:Trk family potassium uptake protein [Agathobacter sp.]
MAKEFKYTLSSFQMIIIGFAGIILLGTLLLMLPFSTQSGTGTSFFDALFTATSAVCVTGLVVQDTATYWSYFGQFVILLLIQIGGMGVVTVASAFALLSGRKLSFSQRNIMQEALSAPQIGGIVKLTRFVIIGTFLFEILGALVMMPVFCKDFGIKGIWMAIFHSISAFCNAGFDLLGINAKYSSLTTYIANPVINITIMLLIVIGGIGFLTWSDILKNRHRISEYRMQSKVILSTTLALILIPTMYFFLIEFSDMPLKERVFASFFQAITPRTAGFNTVDFGVLSEAGIGIIILLMLIGGSPGSTAGGMKTTTVTVLFANAKAVFRRKEETDLFGRRIPNETIRTAATILILYVTLFFCGGVFMSIIEKLPMITCLFETASAIGTVGLTLGITPQLGVVSRALLIFLMFFGRVGGLTLIFATVSGTNKHFSKLPQEKITVG